MEIVNWGILMNWRMTVGWILFKRIFKCFNKFPPKATLLSTQIFPWHAKYHHLASPDNKPRQLPVMSPRRCTQPDPIANSSVINREISISFLSPVSYRTISIRIMHRKQSEKCGADGVN